MKFLSRIQFLLRSKNQHGIHSPFVYQWATQCLYAPPKIGSEKMLGITLKCIGYFGYQNLQVQHAGDAEKIKQQYPNACFEKAPFDLVLLRTADASYIKELLENDQLHNNSMIVVKNIHSDEVQESHWKSLIASEYITVSVDLFYCGIVFLRREQVKEHFNIRI